MAPARGSMAGARGAPAASGVPAASGAGSADFLRLDLQLCFALYSAGHAMTKAYARFLDPLGLTYPQYLTMIVLWEADGVPVKTLGARLRLDSGTLTPLLKRLEGMGLIARRRDAADERVVRIDLTDAGRALKVRAQDVPLAVAQACGRPPEDLFRLRADLIALRDHLARPGEGADTP